MQVVFAHEQPGHHSPDDAGGRRVGCATLRTVQRLVIMALCASVTACSTVPHNTPEVLSPAARHQAAEEIQVFSASGKLGVWSDEQSASTRVRWQSDAQTTDIVLTAPLGLGRWRAVEDITATDEWRRASLQRGGDTPVYGASLDELMALALGFSLPVRQVEAWIRGLPGAGDAATYDTYGRLLSVRFTDSAGQRWVARMLRYRQEGDVQIPELITAQGRVASSDGKNTLYRLRWVLNEWKELVDWADITPSGQPGQSRPPPRLSLPSPP